MTRVSRGGEAIEPLEKITEDRAVDFFGNIVVGSAEERTEAAMPLAEEITPAEGIMMGPITEEARREANEAKARAERARGKRVASPPTEELQAAGVEGQEGSSELQENAAKRSCVTEPLNPFGFKFYYSRGAGPFTDCGQACAGYVWRSKTNPNAKPEWGDLTHAEAYKNLVLDQVQAEKAEGEKKARDTALLLDQEIARLQNSKEDERRAAIFRTRKAMVDENTGLLAKVKRYMAQKPKVEQIISTVAHIERVLAFYLGLEEKRMKFPYGLLEKLKADQMKLVEKSKDFEEVEESWQLLMRFFHLLQKGPETSCRR